MSIAENVTAIASYTATDDDAGDTVSWSLTGDDSSLFDISDSGELTFISAPDYETPLGGINDDSNTYSLTVTAVDGTGKGDFTDLSVNVNDIFDHAPVLNVNATAAVSIAENTTAVSTYTVTDADPGDTVSWSLTGDDTSLFNISSDGVLTFKSAPDYETPGSAASSNAYSVTVTATDSVGLTDSTDLTVNVDDVNEAPVLNLSLIHI